ncbi:BAHD acyltransferase BIA1-like [Momordica charantia]|uniref:BAHD acyltransferase BIA1-like n=1 Tax=Momordica charantia TaxID=3673 RepID=A0A6J1CAD9_MOMCH|nr:BAHD acyltransferase BIA1-like [Momordica charantia]
MEVKILSRETIMPSSPTPPHLKTFELSLIDQLSPPLYIPLLFFYPIKNKHDLETHNQKKAIATLKNSLSKTLTNFFLLAGRITNTSIRCSNDEGAVFIEATVNCNISDILKEPNNEVLTKLLPCSIQCTKPTEEYAQIVAQANIFNCGGIVISLCLLHKLMDGISFSCFLKSWASINKGSLDNSSQNLVCSNYKTFSSLFPQTNLLSFHHQIHEGVDDICSSSKPNRCLQRFVFGAKAISDLKAKAKSTEVPNPTSVEALTGFIWNCAMKLKATSMGNDDDSQRPSTLSHVVNLRKRMEPPLPEISIGNVLWGMVAHYCSSNYETQVELRDLVVLLRQSFSKINNDFIKGLMGNDGNRAVLELLGEINKFPSKVPNYYFFTSWRNMDLNEVDFGWGKPIWIGIAGNSNVITKDFILLLDTPSGDGIEAWMVLDQKKMKLLQQNPQFLEFASLNPSISIKGEVEDLNL